MAWNIHRKIFNNVVKGFMCQFINRCSFRGINAPKVNNNFSPASI